MPKVQVALLEPAKEGQEGDREATQSPVTDTPDSGHLSRTKPGPGTLFPEEDSAERAPAIP